MYSIQNTPTDSSSGTPLSMKNRVFDDDDNDDDDLFSLKVAPESKSSNVKTSEPSKVNVCVTQRKEYSVVYTGFKLPFNDIGSHVILLLVLQLSVFSICSDSYVCEYSL